MTTIFADFKAGVMVCDSQCSEGNEWFPVTKVRRIGNELIGIAGDVKSGDTWLAWYAKGKKGPRPKITEFGALVLRQDGLYSIYDNGLELLMERGFHGVGSGGAMAVAAYMAGATPVKAVEIACQIDIGSGGDVKTYTLAA